MVMIDLATRAAFFLKWIFNVIWRKTEVKREKEVIFFHLSLR